MKITVFTDGSSRGNPGPGGWGSVIVAGAVSAADSQVIELGGGETRTTNNRMEIMAAAEALAHIGRELKAKDASEIAIHTDSSYLINGITKWVKGWQAKGWITAAKEEVQNRDLWEALMSAVAAAERATGARISWKYVGGHVGIAGNERCDEIATGFADSILKNDPSLKPSLYRGTFADYLVSNILDISIDTEATKKKSAEKSEKNSRSKAKAYSYVSEVDGKVMVHYSWAECEARVKGKRARFKKALSPGEERAIAAEFGSKSK
ncbi:MAG: ribonuclease [Candidatus Taylorbacteria bacterium]|nr:ribonuclease [Candidatus Taylorbacteria bacterium]